MTIEPDRPGAAGEATGKPAIRSRKTPRTRVVEIVFTPDQVAYLEERMSIVREVRPMRRAGGSSLRRRRPEGLLAT